MIITKKVNITPSYRNITHFKEKGYTCKVGEELEINVKDLSPNSRLKVDIECEICGEGKILAYNKYLENYNRYGYYSCRKCSGLKKKKTYLENFGVDNPMKNDSIKQKGKDTKKDKYGDENYNNMEKYKETCKEKFGTEYALSSDIIRDKINNTVKEKYDVDHITQVPSIKERISEKNRLFNLNNSLEIYKNKHNLNIINIDQKNNLLQIKCDKCDKVYEINRNMLQLRLLSKNELCTICNKTGNNISGKEMSLLNFIKNNYNGKIITNTKQIIKPYEIDIYLPELNLAFEFNGVYWHNELNKSKNYHNIKTNLCNDLNIHLVHIWEDIWDYKQDTVKSFILNKINKTPNRIYARKCELKVVSDNKIIREFLDKNHLQGFVGSSIKLGLYYNDELVSLMTFGGLRKMMGSNNEKNKYELIRFCNKQNTNIIGGASKLFKYFINNYEYSEIISYADRSYSNGKLYETLNFDYIHTTPPNYYYVVNGLRKHRFMYRKGNLIKEGYDKNKTEHEIMLERKIYRIYNSGNMKYIYKQK